MTFISTISFKTVNFFFTLRFDFSFVRIERNNVGKSCTIKKYAKRWTMCLLVMSNYYFVHTKKFVILISIFAVYFVSLFIVNFQKAILKNEFWDLGTVIIKFSKKCFRDLSHLFLTFGHPVFKTWGNAKLNTNWKYNGRRQ